MKALGEIFYILFFVFSILGFAYLLGQHFIKGRVAGTDIEVTVPQVGVGGGPPSITPCTVFPTDIREHFPTPT